MEIKIESILGKKVVPLEIACRCCGVHLGWSFDKEPKNYYCHQCYDGNKKHLDCRYREDSVQLGIDIIMCGYMKDQPCIYDLEGICPYWKKLLEPSAKDKGDE